jgi:two-component system OmpR family response regulator
MVDVELKRMQLRLVVLEDKVETFVRIIERAGLLSEEIERTGRAGFGHLTDDALLPTAGSHVRQQRDDQPRESSGKLVLIADDYEDLAQVVAELLECDTLYKTVSAQDGQAALDLALRHRPDACLLDIDMPGLDGMEVARRIREHFKEHSPYLIAVTGRADFNAVVLTGRFDVALQKPVDLKELLHALDNM